MDEPLSRNTEATASKTSAPSSTLPRAALDTWTGVSIAASGVSLHPLFPAGCTTRSAWWS